MTSIPTVTRTIGRALEVQFWPEFQAFAKRLGIDLEDGYTHIAIDWPNNTVTGTQLLSEEPDATAAAKALWSCCDSPDAFEFLKRWPWLGE